jgi:hypothetical protein
MMVYKATILVPNGIAQLNLERKKQVYSLRMQQSRFRKPNRKFHFLSLSYVITLFFAADTDVSSLSTAVFLLRCSYKWIPGKAFLK